MIISEKIEKANQLLNAILAERQGPKMGGSTVDLKESVIYLKSVLRDIQTAHDKVYMHLMNPHKCCIDGWMVLNWKIAELLDLELNS